MRYFEGLKENHSSFMCTKHMSAFKNTMDCTMAMHIQPGIEMIYVINGKFDFLINKRVETVHSGEIGIVFPFQPHGYKRYEGAEYVRFDFETELAGDFFNSKHDVIGERAVFSASEVTAFTINKHFIESENHSRLSVQNLLYSALSDFMNQVKLVPIEKNDNILIKVINYTRENIDKPLQMNTVAKTLGYSDSYFSRAINKTTGFGFNTLLAMIRTESAKKLLRETKKTILEIVLECGFGSERSFYRQFKDITGLSPLKYRNSLYEQI